MAKTKLIPGFRFHPTDVELLKYFLKRKVMGKKLVDVIAEVNIYKYAPWDLPDKSCLGTGDLEWYFFCPREKKYASGARMNRATEVGYWKTTGRDRPVHHENQRVGLIKTLIFHLGKAPKGDRTDWVMHEFRLEDNDLTDKGIPQDSYVLCKIFQKDGLGPRNGAQYGKPFNDEDWDDDEKIECVDSIPLIAMSALPILPITHHSSVATDKHPPAGGCIGSSSVSCLSGVVPPSPCLMHPSVPSDKVISNDGSQVPSDKVISNDSSVPSDKVISNDGSQVPVDDDIFSMLGCLTEDDTLAMNEKTVEKMDNSGQQKVGEVAPSLDVNDIFKDLGDIDNATGWGNGHDFCSGQQAEYNTNQMFCTGSMSIGLGDPDYLELLDLDSPLYQQTEQHGSWGPFDPEKQGL